MEGTSVTSIEVSWNRILDSNVNALCQCPPVPDENREAMRTTSMMHDCNASALLYYVCLALKFYGLVRRCPLVYQAKWAIKSEGFRLSSQIGS